MILHILCQITCWGGSRGAFLKHQKGDVKLLEKLLEIA